MFRSGPFGLALQLIALALYDVALVGGLRKREEAAALNVKALEKALALHRIRHLSHTRRDVKWAVGKAPASELDRAAASVGLRDLYESGKRPEDRVGTILPSIG
jgi:hypothetical protein